MTRKTLSGTYSGDLFGVPATGKQISTEVIDILHLEDGHLEDGKLAEHWNLADQVGLMQQLGVIPAHQSTAFNAGRGEAA